MERFIRHFLVLALVAAFLTTGLPQFLARFFNNDFHITDMYYQIRDDQHDPFEEEVVLVNVSSLSREGVAKEIFHLAQYQPKVIALDIIFMGERDSVGDGLLQYVLMNTPNVVLIGESQRKADNSGDSLVVSHPMFSSFTYHGIGENIVDANVGRRMQKKYYFADGDSALHFATQIAMLYDSTKALEFLKRPNKQENIYFLGNIPSYEENPKPSKFSVLDVEDVMQENFTPDLIQGKIVLMGYLGEYAGDPGIIEDKFFSPLKAYIPVKTPPDMFGVVFHANTISMILNQRFIEQLSPEEEGQFAFAICFFNVLILLLILWGKHTRKWFLVLSASLVVVEIASYPQIAIYLFDKYRYLAELTYTPFLVALSPYIARIYVHRLLRMFSDYWWQKTDY